MDRRQKKTREAIFSAFTQLLSEKNSKGEIIENLAIGKKQTIEGIDASILAIDKSLELFVSELNKRKSQDETKGCSSSECEPNS